MRSGPVGVTTMSWTTRCHDPTDSPRQTLLVALAFAAPVAAGLVVLVGPTLGAGALLAAVAAAVGRAPVTADLPRGGADPDLDPDCGPRRVACDC